MGLSFILVPHHLLHRPVSSISVVLWDQAEAHILAIQIIFVLPFSHGQLIQPDTHGQKKMRNLIYYECEKQDQSGHKTHSSLKLANMIQSCPWILAVLADSGRIVSHRLRRSYCSTTPTYPAFLSFEEILLFEALTLLGLFRLLSLILIEVDEKAFRCCVFPVETQFSK